MNEEVRRIVDEWGQNHQYTMEYGREHIEDLATRVEAAVLAAQQKDAKVSGVVAELIARVEKELEKHKTPSEESKDIPVLGAEEKKGMDIHRSDCATNNEPSSPNGPCDCRPAVPGDEELTSIVDETARTWNRGHPGRATYDGYGMAIARAVRDAMPRMTDEDEQILAKRRFPVFRADDEDARTHHNVYRLGLQDARDFYEKGERK
jgi:hypothetical protein